MTATETANLIKVPMAGIGFAKGYDSLETLLGSCVGIAVWERNLRIAGLAHIMLPDSGGPTKSLGKYADTAVSELKRQLMAWGASPRSLCAKIAGGATMFGARTATDVGERNCIAVRAHLSYHGIPIVAEHIGGTHGRIVRFRLDDFGMDVFIGRDLTAVI